MNNVKQLEFLRMESTQYGFDLLAKNFEDEVILSQVFINSVKKDKYEKVDMIVKGFHKYLCELIDNSDYLLICGPDSRFYKDIPKEKYDLIKIGEEEAPEKELYDITSKENKKIIKDNIRFCLTYNNHEPIFLKNYKSKQVIQKQPSERTAYYFIKNGVVNYIFDDYYCLVEDFNEMEDIDEIFEKYRSVFEYFF